MSDGGKGSKPRPFSVAQDEYEKRWDAIFQHRAPTAQFIAHQNRDSFQLKVNAFAKTGWHLIDLETYIANNQRLWAGVVTQNEKKATLVTELEAEAFQKKYCLPLFHAISIQHQKQYPQETKFLIIHHYS
jgi:hypothetical protein